MGEAGDGLRVLNINVGIRGSHRQRQDQPCAGTQHSAVHRSSGQHPQSAERGITLDPRILRLPGVYSL